MSSASDAELVRSAARGDAAAWHALVERHAGLVWSVAQGYGLTVDDAAAVSQATWRRLACHLRRMDDPSRVGDWLAIRAAQASRTRRGPGRTTRTSTAV